jgi:hypothetical protein
MKASEFVALIRAFAKAGGCSVDGEECPIDGSWCDQEPYCMAEQLNGLLDEMGVEVDE